MLLTRPVLVVTEFMQLELVFSAELRSFEPLILSSPRWPGSFCRFEPLASPPPPALGSDAPPCCCGWSTPVSGIYSHLPAPAQPRSSSVRFFTASPVEDGLFWSLQNLLQSARFQSQSFAGSGRLVRGGSLLLNLRFLGVDRPLQLCSIVLQLLDLSPELVVQVVLRRQAAGVVVPEQRSHDQSDRVHEAHKQVGVNLHKCPSNFTFL